MVFNKSRTTDKRKYHATLTLPIKTSDNEEFDRLRLSLKKSLKAKDRRIKAEVKRILSSLPVFTGTFQIQKFISISGFEKFFRKRIQ